MINELANLFMVLASSMFRCIVWSINCYYAYSIGFPGRVILYSFQYIASILYYYIISLSTLALTPDQIFAFKSDLAKIRPGIDCMLENVLPSLTGKTPEVSPRVFTNLSVYRAALNNHLQRQQSSLTTTV